VLVTDTVGRAPRRLALGRAGGRRVTTLPSAERQVLVRLEAEQTRDRHRPPATSCAGPAETNRTSPYARLTRHPVAFRQRCLDCRSLREGRHGGHSRRDVAFTDRATTTKPPPFADAQAANKRRDSPTQKCRTKAARLELRTSGACPVRRPTDCCSLGERKPSDLTPIEPSGHDWFGTNASTSADDVRAAAYSARCSTDGCGRRR
jgi:hypothetical protein